MMLERRARLRHDAERYRQAREARPARLDPVRAAIEVRLSACRQELERLTRRRGAAGHSTE